MLDLAFIRNNPDIVKEAARVKNNTLDIDHLLEVDRQVLALQRQVEEIRAEQNQISKRVQQAGKDKELRDALIAQGKQLADQIKALEPRLRELEDERQQLLYYVPNIPDPSAPIGNDENDNVPFKYWGEPPKFDFEPLDHYALMQKLDVVDIERAVKVAGARSYALKGDAARLELALMNFAMDRVARKGFTPIIVPAMARDFCFIGSGQFPKGRDQVYALEDEDLFLVGTAEVSITGMYKDEILKAENLPMTFVGYCPCFRKEAGTYGKDTRGVFRIHQFNKVEQYVICKADHEESVRWHEQLLANSEELVQALELPYRVVNVCTGDMGDGKVGMYDLECWIPSEGRYRETHSCSYFHDWQARRVNIRYRDEDGKVRFVHTLNNTAIASPRILLPLFEIHQQPDGSVRIPEALRPYMGGQEYIRPREAVKAER
ncbi:MAG TPA: serine--tRNA ligase [Ktedonobacteraceae bacterium]|nr:serine--tRNA ligase [Ktedonobacteraceae bacterium]